MTNVNKLLHARLADDMEKMFSEKESPGKDSFGVTWDVRDCTDASPQPRFVMIPKQRLEPCRNKIMKNQYDKSQKAWVAATTDTDRQTDRDRRQTDSQRQTDIDRHTDRQTD